MKDVEYSNFSDNVLRRMSGKCPWMTWTQCHINDVNVAIMKKIWSIRLSDIRTHTRYGKNLQFFLDVYYIEMFQFFRKVFHKSGLLVIKSTFPWRVKSYLLHYCDLLSGMKCFKHRKTYFKNDMKLANSSKPLLFLVLVFINVHVMLFVVTATCS